MTDAMLPIVRQFHDATDDRARAEILLRVPDRVLWENSEQYEAACRRAGFYAGVAFIAWRLASFNAVRGSDGLCKPGSDRVRVLFAAFASDTPAPADDAEHGVTAPNPREVRL